MEMQTHLKLQHCVREAAKYSANELIHELQASRVPLSMCATAANYQHGGSSTVPRPSPAHLRKLPVLSRLVFCITKRLPCTRTQACMPVQPTS